MKNLICILLIAFAVAACKNSEEVKKEPWADQPVAEWPKLVFTNDIVFRDTVYKGIGNAFLVDTGKDTLGITCKHIFLIFRHDELLTIDPGDNFMEWKVYLKGDESRHILFGDMRNRNPSEKVDAFNTLKSRDWLIFEVDNVPDGFTPFKIRTRPVQKNEIIYCLGWPYAQKEGSPSLVKMEMYSNMGPYYYVNTLTENVDHGGRSGSPVFDANGYLVGIVSGAEGNLGVICNVNYLEQFIK